MDRDRLKGYLEQGLSLDQMGTLAGKHASTIAYWLGKHGLRANGADRHAPKGAIDRESLAEMVGRGRTLSEIAAEFGRSITTVRQCRTEAVSEWRRRTKAKLVAEAGGRCVLCGYDRHQAALQFHHLDPSKKEFHLADTGVTRSIERLRREVEKCVLLCGNCHAEVEAGFTEF